MGSIFDVRYRHTFGDNPAQAFTGINADLASDTAADSGLVINNLKFKNIVTPHFSESVAGDTFICDNVTPVVKITGNIKF